MDNPICANFRQLLAVGFSLAVGADIPEDLSQHSVLSGEKRSTSQSSIRNSFSFPNGNRETGSFHMTPFFLVGSLLLGTLVTFGLRESSFEGNDFCFPTNPETKASSSNENSQCAPKKRKNDSGDNSGPTEKRTREQFPKGKEIQRSHKLPEESDSKSETTASSDAKTSELTENSPPSDNRSPDFAAADSSNVPKLSDDVKKSLQNKLGFEDSTQKRKPFDRTMGGAEVFSKLDKLIEEASVYGLEYHRNLPLLNFKENSEEKRNFESFVKKNFSTYLENDDYFSSMSAVKTDDGERILIIWIGRHMSNDVRALIPAPLPIFVPFQREKENFDKFLEEMNPSETFEANEKEFVKALISFKKTNKKVYEKVFEMPISFKTYYYIIPKVLNFPKTWKDNGAFEVEQEHLSFGMYTSNEFLQEVLCIQTPGSRILNVKTWHKTDRNYIFAFKKDDCEEVDSFFTKNEKSVLLVNTKQELIQRLEKKKEAEKAASEAFLAEEKEKDDHLAYLAYMQNLS